MTGQRQPRGPWAKRKSPAERAEEHAATQRRLKQEAADRHDAAAAGKSTGRKRRG